MRLLSNMNNAMSSFQGQKAENFGNQISARRKEIFLPNATGSVRITGARLLILKMYQYRLQYIAMVITTCLFPSSKC